MKGELRLLSLDASNQSDIIDRVKTMVTQDASTYKCGDYLARRGKDVARKQCSCCDSQKNTVLDVDDMVDAVCREKMCEWSYRVCDHFGVGREIVAVAFACLDRFMDRRNCDRTAFKLAAMTSLYMTTKVFQTQRIRLRSLVELSRGEFEERHITEMEMIMLQTLEWRVHPPTIQCFIEPFCAVLTPSDLQITACIQQRAIFFAELALYDYSFVSKEKPLVAVAAILNAIEGLENGPIPEIRFAAFLSALASTFDMEFDHQKVEGMRHRLWYIYSMSAQYQEDEIGAVDQPQDMMHIKVTEHNFPQSMDHSPICVTSTW